MRWWTMIPVLLGWLAPAAMAQPAFELGELRIPAPRGYVNDYAGVLSPDEWSRLEGLCRQIDRDTGAQIALAIVSDLHAPGVIKKDSQEILLWHNRRQNQNRTR